MSNHHYLVEVPVRTKVKATKPNRKCGQAELTSLGRHSAYGRRHPEKKPQPSKSEDVGPCGTGIENVHLRITIDAMQQTLDRYGVVLMGRGQVRSTPGPLPRRGPPNTTGTTNSESSGVTREDQRNSTGHRLKIMQWNAEGVREKKRELQKFLKEHDIDVCCLQETHLTSECRFSLRGYEIFRHDRRNRPKGGVLTAIKTRFSAWEIQKSELEDTEYINVCLRISENDFTICNIYSPPNKDIHLNNIKPSQKNWIIVGDFNSHSPSWGYTDLNAKGEDVEDFITANRLVILNQPDDPHSFYSRTWRTTSNPDLAIATEDVEKVMTRSVCQQLGGSDHKPIIIDIQGPKDTSKRNLPPSWNYKKANWSLFSSHIDGALEKRKIGKMALNTKLNIFNKCVLEAAKTSIPRGRRKDYQPYWSPKLDELHTELSAHRENMEMNPTDENIILHNKTKAAFTREKKKSMRHSWHEKTASLNLEKDTTKLWNLTKTLNGEKPEKTKTVLHADSGFVTGKAAADLLATTYQSESKVHIPNRRIKEVKTQSRSLLKNLKTQNPVECMSAKFTLPELEEGIKNIKEKKAPGADGITNEFLKHLGPYGKMFLLKIFNQSWRTGLVPSIWKEAQNPSHPETRKGKTRPKELQTYQSLKLCRETDGEIGK